MPAPHDAKARSASLNWKEVQGSLAREKGVGFLGGNQSLLAITA
jgi:hypothetical protein